MSFTKTQVRILSAAADGNLEYKFGGIAVKGENRKINGHTLQALHGYLDFDTLRPTSEGKAYLNRQPKHPRHQRPTKHDDQAALCSQCGSWKIVLDVSGLWKCQKCGAIYEVK